MKPVTPDSVWRIACERLERARQASWADTAKAEAAWAVVTAGEPKLLAAAEHMADIVDKLRYLLELNEPEGTRHRPPAQKPWKLRLLHSVLRDATRLAGEVEQNQRCESLRRHAAQLGNEGEMAAQLASARRELNEMRAERDAAYAALERANGFCRGLVEVMQP